MFKVMTQDSNETNILTEAVPHGITPSEFMRKLRPEYYSDSEARTTIALTADQLEYRLETITARNQTHDFELFCRKLCERAICPNLRAQTGPEGGGDSQVDTESLPVSEEVQERFFEGLANTGSEKWAFAISAEKTWTDKARRDVKKIAETHRGYDRIFFITSRHARAKDRARLEDELSKAHGIPVIIHDRTWIVDEVVEKDRKDLAHNFLRAGQTITDGARLGPTDYSRLQQLEDIESEIGNTEAFQGMEMQMASEALVAAKLSRNLERPREETDGRFARAIRLADKYGSSRQALEGRYEQLWTAFWWFNDFDFLLSEYAAFEDRALKSDNAVDLEWLGNMHQLLVNGVTHEHFSADTALLYERASRLEEKFKALASEEERPNNRLEARAAILRIHLNRAMLDRDSEALPAIWEEYSQIVEDARGLGEFSFETLINFIEVAGQVAGNDPAYNALVEKCAKFVAERTSESEAALIYLKRAQKLSFDDNFDMIRWLGKAAIGLSKQEYSDEFVDAMQRLSIAYRSAGLLWAARACCATAMTTLFIEGDRANQIPVRVVPSMKLWAWLSLELWHLPDGLHNIQLLRGMLAALPLDEQSKEKVHSDLKELDIALSSLLLNLGETDVKHLAHLPDVLSGLGLETARTSLLFSLGHLDTLRTEGSVPDEETDEAVYNLMGLLKNQPVSADVQTPLIRNADGPNSYVTQILGMRATIEFEDTKLISVAEAILGTLEAFFATAIDHRIVPYTEQYRIVLVATNGTEPNINSDDSQMTTRVEWPSDLPVADYDRGDKVRTSLAVIAGHVLGASCIVPDSKELLEQMFDDEGVLHRISMIAAFPNSYHRLFQQIYAQLGDWDEHNPAIYELKKPLPELPDAEAKKPHQEEAPESEGEPSMPKSHKQMSVRSVIDLKAWDQAEWRGCGFLHVGDDLPPFVAMLFHDAEAGRRIFERWRERFGDRDVNEEIAISLIRNLPGWSEHHYIAQVTSNVANITPGANSKVISMPIRSLEVTPMNSANLERFLAGYRRFGVYAIVPAIFPKGSQGEPDFMLDLAIEKQALSVFNASEINKHQPEAVVLRMRDIKVE
ncbi:MAG: hypothetical protein V7741_11030 [Hyphomonas sp.]